MLPKQLRDVPIQGNPQKFARKVGRKKGNNCFLREKVVFEACMYYRQQEKERELRKQAHVFFRAFLNV